mmetsp:Transcript_25694/g.88273  ORF Transcript_25694/g.88273 Transcript_25694/m.88273 type:complete len:208 (-) Transcript_25694:810-1433(-)
MFRRRLGLCTPIGRGRPAKVLQLFRFSARKRRDFEAVENAVQCSRRRLRPRFAGGLCARAETAGASFAHAATSQAAPTRRRRRRRQKCTRRARRRRRGARRPPLCARAGARVGGQGSMHRVRRHFPRSEDVLAAPPRGPALRAAGAVEGRRPAALHDLAGRAAASGTRRAAASRGAQSSARCGAAACRGLARGRRAEAARARCKRRR